MVFVLVSKEVPEQGIIGQILTKFAISRVWGYDFSIK